MTMAKDNTDDIEGLQKLLADVDDFTGKIFDWVSFLGRVEFLHDAYAFRTAIEIKINQLENSNA